MAFHTKTYEAYGNIRVKPNQPCNYLNRGHKSKVNIFGQYMLQTLPGHCLRFVLTQDRFYTLLRVITPNNAKYPLQV